MLTRKHLSDAIQQMTETHLMPDTEAEGRRLIEDAILDAIIANSDSPRTVDEMVRVKAGEA